MKKQILLIVTTISLFGLTTKSYAQDTLHVNVGFMFVPQGAMNLEKPDKVFLPVLPIFAVASFVKGKTTINAMYCMTFNTLQVICLEKFTPNFGVYLKVNKSIFANTGYAGVGVTRSVADGKANAFIEVGSGWNIYTPALSMGVIIPFTFKIK